MMQNFMIICACKYAEAGCDKVCPKGQALRPLQVFRIEQWGKKEPVSRDTKITKEEPPDAA